MILILRGIRATLLSGCKNYYDWEILTENWETETRKRIKAKYDFVTQKIEGE